MTLPAGNKPPEWYTKGERTYIDGHAAQLYAHSHISFNLYENVMAVIVHYVYHSDLRGWHDKEVEEYYGPFSDTEYTQDYLYYDRADLNELNGYFLDKGAYLPFDPLPAAADQISDPRTGVWHSSFEKMETLHEWVIPKSLHPNTRSLEFSSNGRFLMPGESTSGRAGFRIRWKYESV